MIFFPPTMTPEEEVEPPQKKKKLPPFQDLPCQSFSLLPNEIAVHCFARIPKSYYPSLSLVCKTFRSLITSSELYAARSQIGTTEIRLYICLRYSTEMFTDPSRRWFSLRVKPNRNLTDGRTKEKSSGNLFVRIHNYSPPPYSNSTVTIGSEIYLFGGPTEDNSQPSSAVRVYERGSRTWRDISNMKMKRRYASACLLDDKIYVMGGCRAWFEDQSWFEMFDLKTQTWKTLPTNPDRNVRLGYTVCKIGAVEGKIYVKTEMELADWVYDVKEGRWSVAERHLSYLWSNSWCVIDNVMYSYAFSRYFWYDLETRTWRDVKGLEGLRKYRSLSNGNYSNSMVEFVNYGGKLAILWDRFEKPGRSQKKNIWCAVVTLEKCPGGAIIGKIEWVDVVLMVPKSYDFVRCLAISL